MWAGAASSSQAQGLSSSTSKATEGNSGAQRIALPASAAAHRAAQDRWHNASGSQVWPFQLRLGARGVASRHGAGSGMAAQVLAAARYYALPVSRLMPNGQSEERAWPRTLPASTPSAVASFLEKGDWRPRSYAEHAALNSGAVGPLPAPAKRRLWRYLLLLEPEAFGPVLSPALGGQGQAGLFKGDALPSVVPPERRALVWGLIRSGVPAELRGWWWCANARLLQLPAPSAPSQNSQTEVESAGQDSGEQDEGADFADKDVNVYPLHEQYICHLRQAVSWLRHRRGEQGRGDAVEPPPVPKSFAKSVSQLANDIRRTMQHLPEVALYSVHVAWELRPDDTQQPEGPHDPSKAAPLCSQYRSAADVRRVSGRVDVASAMLRCGLPSSPATQSPYAAALGDSTLTIDLTGRGVTPPAQQADSASDDLEPPCEPWVVEDFAQRAQLTQAAVTALNLPPLPTQGGLAYFVPPYSLQALKNVEQDHHAAAQQHTGSCWSTPSPCVLYVRVAVTCGALWRVCLSSALAAPVAGYCQGLNFIAAHALRWLDEPHAAALLAAVASTLRLGGQQYYGNMGPPAADLGVLQGYVEHGCSDLVAGAKQLRGAPPSTPMVLHTLTGGGLKWLLCLFATPFPPALTSRVWDAYFAGGAAVLFSTTVALLRLSTPWVLAHARSFPDAVAAVEGIGAGVAAALRGAGETVGEGVQDPHLPLDTPPQDGTDMNSTLAQSVVDADAQGGALWRHAVLPGWSAELVDWPVAIARTSASQRSLQGGGQAQEVAPIFKINTRPIAGASAVNLLTLLFEGWWSNGAARGPRSTCVPALVDDSAQAVLSAMGERGVGGERGSSAQQQAAADVASVAVSLIPSRPDSHTVSHADEALASSILAWSQAQGWGCTLHTHASGDDEGEFATSQSVPRWAALDVVSLLQQPGHTWVAVTGASPHHDVRLGSNGSSSCEGSPPRLWQPHVLVTAPTAAHLLRYILPPIFRGALTDQVMDSVLLPTKPEVKADTPLGTAWWIGDPHACGTHCRDPAGPAAPGIESETSAGAAVAQAALAAALDREAREGGPRTPTGVTSELSRSQRAKGVTATAVVGGAEAGSPRLSAWYLLQGMLRQANGAALGPIVGESQHPALQRASATRSLLCALASWAAYAPLGEATDSDGPVESAAPLPPLDLGGKQQDAKTELPVTVMDTWQTRAPMPATSDPCHLSWPSALLVAVGSPFNGDVLHAAQRAAEGHTAAHPALLLAMGVPLPSPDPSQGTRKNRPAAPLSPPLGAPLLNTMPVPADPDGDGGEHGDEQAVYLGGDSHSFHLPALTVLPVAAIQDTFSPTPTPAGAAGGSRPKRPKHLYAHQASVKLATWWPMHGAPEGPRHTASPTSTPVGIPAAASPRRPSLAQSPGLVVASSFSARDIDAGSTYHTPLNSPVTPLLVDPTRSAPEGAPTAHVRMFSCAVPGACDNALAASPLLWYVLAGAIAAVQAPYITASLLRPNSSTSLRMRQDAGTVQLVSIGEQQLFKHTRPHLQAGDIHAVDGRTVGTPQQSTESTSNQTPGFFSRVFRWGAKAKSPSNAAAPPAQAQVSPAAGRTSSPRHSSGAHLPPWGEKARLQYKSVQHSDSVAFEVPMHGAVAKLQVAAQGATQQLLSAVTVAASHPARVLASLPVPFSACSWSDPTTVVSKRQGRKSLTVPPRPPPKDLSMYAEGGVWGVWALFPSLHWLEGAYGVLCTPPSPDLSEVVPTSRRTSASPAQDGTPVAHPHGHSMAAGRRGQSAGSAPSSQRGTPSGDAGAPPSARTPQSSARSARRSLAVVVEGGDKRMAGQLAASDDGFVQQAATSLSSALAAAVRGWGLEGLAGVEAGQGGLQAQRRIRWAAEAAAQWNSHKRTAGLNYPEFCEAFGADPLTSLRSEERLLLLPPDAPDADLLWHQSQQGDEGDADDDMVAAVDAMDMIPEPPSPESSPEKSKSGTGVSSPPLHLPSRKESGPSTRRAPSMRRAAEVRRLSALERMMPGRGGSLRRFALVSRRGGGSGAPPPEQPCQRVYALWFTAGDLAPPLGAVPKPEDGRTPLNMQAQEEGALMLHLAEGAPSLLIEGYFRHFPSRSQQGAPQGAQGNADKQLTSPAAATPTPRLARGNRTTSDAHSYTPHAHLMGGRRWRSPRASPAGSICEEHHASDGRDGGASSKSGPAVRSGSPPPSARPKGLVKGGGKAPSGGSRRQALGGIKGGLASASTSTRSTLRTSVAEDAAQSQRDAAFLGEGCPPHLKQAAVEGAGVLPLPLALEAPLQSVHGALRASMESGQGGMPPVDLSVHDDGESKHAALPAATRPSSLSHHSARSDSVGRSGSLLASSPSRAPHGSLGEVMTLHLARLAADDDSSSVDSSGDEAGDGEDSDGMDMSLEGASLFPQQRGPSILSAAEVLGERDAGVASVPPLTPTAPEAGAPTRRSKRALTTSKPKQQQQASHQDPSSPDAASSGRRQRGRSSLMDALLDGLSGQYVKQVLIHEEYFDA